jgi:hypothetical protein
MAHGSNDRLTAVIDIHVPHDHLLADLSVYLASGSAQQVGFRNDTAP